MFATEGFDLWWLIPLILIALCLFCARGCCAGRRHRLEERPERGDGNPSGSAREILDRRYALGEIDEEEYERKRKTITRKTRGEI